MPLASRCSAGFYLTDDEEARLMKALASDADRQRVTVLLQTGLRKSEFVVSGGRTLT